MFEETTLKGIRSGFESWEQTKTGELQKERKPSFTSESGIEIKRVYTPLDVEEEGTDYINDIGFPGAFPFTRGATATGYRGQLWGIQQYAGHPTPQTSNKLWKAQIASGARDFSVAYDLPSQLGYDPDHPKAEGEVGRIGISMCSIEDWRAAFEDIDLNGLSVGQTLNAPAVVGVANLVCLANDKKVPLENIRGFVQNDILKEYQARGCYIFPPAPSLRLAIDIAVYCSKHMPLYNGMTTCTYHHYECGATPANEAAIGLSNAFTYYENMLARGLDIDTVAPTMRFIIACDHRSFFEHIAKIRAMRRIYARTMKEKFGAKKPESMRFRSYAGKSGLTLYREQYLNNIARCTIAGLAAVFAGSQSIGIRTYDEAFGIPSEEAIITSTRVQQVIAHETGIPDTVDPFGGSYFIESLTSQLEEKICKELENIDRLGGSIRCTETGYFRKLMALDAYRWQRKSESGENVIVGVNRFQTDREEERPVRPYRADPAVQSERIETVRKFKSKRNSHMVQKALDGVKTVALEQGQGAGNLVEPVIEAVKNQCTIGDICDSLREVWGEYTEPKLRL